MMDEDRQIMISDPETINNITKYSDPDHIVIYSGFPLSSCALLNVSEALLFSLLCFIHGNQVLALCKITAVELNRTQSTYEKTAIGIAGILEIDLGQ